jgi:hypothetical protein
MQPALPSALAPARRRRALPWRVERRVAMHAARGCRPHQVAKLVNITEEEVEGLLDGEDLAPLVDHYRRILDLPEDERMARLVGLADLLLDIALEERNLTAALFVLREHRLKRRAALTLVQTMIRREARALRKETDLLAGTPPDPPRPPTLDGFRDAYPPSIAPLVDEIARLEPVALPEATAAPASDATKDQGEPEGEPVSPPNHPRPLAKPKSPVAAFASSLLSGTAGLVAGGWRGKKTKLFQGQLPAKPQGP